MANESDRYLRLDEVLMRTSLRRDPLSENSGRQLPGTGQTFPSPLRLEGIRHQTLVRQSHVLERRPHVIS